MGQKINPINLRINNKENKKIQWYSEKKQYNKYFFLENELKKYIETLLKNKDSFLIDKKIKYLSNKIIIYIYIQKKIKINKKNIEKNSINFLKKLNFNQKKINYFFINLNTKFLKKNNKILSNLLFLKKKNKLNYKMKLMLNILNLTLYTQNSNLLNNYIIINLKKTKKHKQYLNNINKVFKKLYKNYNFFIGYKIQIKGRINGIDRSKKLVLQEGKIPLNTINSKISYSFKEIITSYGVCSIKIWLVFK